VEEEVRIYSRGSEEARHRIPQHSNDPLMDIQRVAVSRDPTLSQEQAPYPLSELDLTALEPSHLAFL
jgi:hypothetical protein